MTHTYEDEEGGSSFSGNPLVDDTNNSRTRHFKRLFFGKKLMDALTNSPEKQKEALISERMENLDLQEIADASRRKYPRPH